MPATERSAADRPVDDRPVAPSGLATVEQGFTDVPAAVSAVPSSAGASFPREARLLDKPAYDTVFGDNRRLADRYWTVLVHDPAARSDASTPRFTGARLGLAIAKKRAKRAVDRNRIKRVARESFRHARASLGDRQVVIMNRDAARDADAAELRRALDALWTRLLRQSPVGKSHGDGRRVP